MMHIIHNNKKTMAQGCVAAIGNFDGLHLGHQAVIAQLQAEARKRHLPSMVVTFEPLPREYFQREQQPVARLTRLREKLALLQKLQIDKTAVIAFNHPLSQLTPRLFVQQILVQQLSVQCVIVGDDFHFGYQRQGNVQLLQQLGEEFGFSVCMADTYSLNNKRVSSSLVREALAEGHLLQASHLLGRNYSMIGRVIAGEKRGRTLGFPTANIAIKRKTSPLLGVYAVQASIAGQPAIKGVANLGCRPTVDGTKTLLEVYLLDFDSTIYGEQVEVTFLHKIRDEIKFNSLTELKQQLIQDEQSARQFFSLQS